MEVWWDHRRVPAESKPRVWQPPGLNQINIQLQWLDYRRLDGIVFCLKGWSGKRKQLQSKVRFPFMICWFLILQPNPGGLVSINWHISLRKKTLDRQPDTSSKSKFLKSYLSWGFQYFLSFFQYLSSQAQKEGHYMERSAQLVQVYFKYRSKIRLRLGGVGVFFLWLQSKKLRASICKKKKKGW